MRQYYYSPQSDLSNNRMLTVLRVGMADSPM